MHSSRCCQVGGNGNGVMGKEIRGKYVILPINNGNLITVCLFMIHVGTVVDNIV